MTKTMSTSTLARQAAKTKNKAHAKRLRAQAAKLRRDQRLADAAGLAHNKKIMAKMDRAIAEGKHSGIVSGLNPRLMHPATEQPGHGEIVGGYLAQKAKEIADLARKKGGVDAIQGRLMTLEHQTRHDEKVYARERERKAVQAAREEMRDNSICGFIALVDAANNTKSMATVSFISSDLIGHIVDALKAYGYRAVGKR